MADNTNTPSLVGMISATGAAQRDAADSRFKTVKSGKNGDSNHAGTDSQDAAKGKRGGFDGFLNTFLGKDKAGAANSNRPARTTASGKKSAAAAGNAPTLNEHLKNAEKPSRKSGSKKLDTPRQAVARVAAGDRRALKESMEKTVAPEAVSPENAAEAVPEEFPPEVLAAADEAAAMIWSLLYGQIEALPEVALPPEMMPAAMEPGEILPEDMASGEALPVDIVTADGKNIGVNAAEVQGAEGQSAEEQLAGIGLTGEGLAGIGEEPDAAAESADALKALVSRIGSALPGNIISDSALRGIEADGAVDLSALQDAIDTANASAEMNSAAVLSALDDLLEGMPRAALEEALSRTADAMGIPADGEGDVFGRIAEALGAEVIDVGGGEAALLSFLGGAAVHRDATVRRDATVAADAEAVAVRTAPPADAAKPVAATELVETTELVAEAVDTEIETPVDADVETEVAASVDVPVEADIDADGAMPAKAEVEVKAEVPVDAEVETEVKAPVDAPVKTPVDAEAKAETLTEVPARANVAAEPVVNAAMAVASDVDVADVPARTDVVTESEVVEQETVVSVAAEGEDAAAAEREPALAPKLELEPEREPELELEPELEPEHKPVQGKPVETAPEAGHESELEPAREPEQNKPLEAAESTGKSPAHEDDVEAAENLRKLFVKFIEENPEAGKQGKTDVAAAAKDAKILQQFSNWLVESGNVKEAKQLEAYQSAFAKPFAPRIAEGIRIPVMVSEKLQQIDPKQELYLQKVPGEAGIAAGAPASKEATVEFLKFGKPAAPAEPFAPGGIPGVQAQPVQTPAEARTGTANPLSMSTMLDQMENIERLTEVMKMSAKQNGVKELTMQLTPAELGKVMLKVESVDGKINAYLRVEKPEAAAHLGSALDQLRQTLKEQGIDVGEMNLRQQGANEALGDFSGQRHSGRETNESRERGRRRHNGRRFEDEEADAPVAVSSKRTGPGALNLFA